MSEQTRAALKTFGIQTTQLEEAVTLLEKNPSPENLRNYLDSQRKLLESLTEILSVVSTLLNRGASAAEKVNQQNSGG
uniref:Uncharacterized protein n=1 Tax=uncultured crenarchaeote TaxID=29281 RepID=H5SGF6_9CREN|nr:hypothetical protein HGMM_F25A04C28 [uncultured crenarchaeote]